MFYDIAIAQVHVRRLHVIRHLLILFQFVCIPSVHCATLELSSFLLPRKVDEVPGHQEMTWRLVSSEKSLVVC